MHPILETHKLQLTPDPAVVVPDVLLAPGDLVWLDASRFETAIVTAWFDALTGLAPVVSGAIHLDGQPWDQRSAWEQDHLRGRIRRVDREGGWVSNLDVTENIILAERHFGDRPEQAILQDAAALAGRLALPCLPEGRPAYASPEGLRQANWVRGLLGNPLLLLVHERTPDLPEATVAGIRQVVAEKRRQGAAVLWIGYERFAQER